MEPLLLLISLSVLTITMVVVTLNVLQLIRKKRLRKIIKSFEIQKNTIDSAPINPELSKIKSFFKTKELDIMYNEWNERLRKIKEIRIPSITDMLLETDYHMARLDYKNINYDIAKIELELYKLKTDSKKLLEEIKEVTNSEEKNRDIITKLKIEYRTLNSHFTERANDFGSYKGNIELQLENISSRFESLELEMTKNNYTEVTKMIDNLDDMLKHMKLVVDEAPVLVLTLTTLLPKKIEDVKRNHKKLIDEGYPLDYLNIEYNIEESEKRIKEILDRLKILDLEDSLFETKILVEYFDNIFNDFEKEKLNKNIFEESTESLKIKLEKINNLVLGLFKQLDEIKENYDLNEEDILSLTEVKEELEKVNRDYDTLISHTSNNTTFAYSRLAREVEALILKLSEVEDRLEYSLNNLGNMKEDETRAHEQLDEIRVIYKETQIKIQKSNLPVIPNNLFVEADEASDAIKEIINELNNSPIKVEILNTRVDTARDLVLKFYSSTNKAIKASRFAEIAIVYSNRYRSKSAETDRNLIIAENTFNKGNYIKSLELTIQTVGKYDAQLEEKLVELYKG